MYIGIALTVGISNSSFAMTEKELKQKVDLASLAQRCSLYNYYANDLKESKRLADLSLYTFLNVSPELISKFKSNETPNEISPEFRDRLNDDFYTGYMAAFLSAVEHEEASLEVFGTRQGFLKRELSTEESKNSSKKAKDLVEQNNCRFIK